ncbi:MAG: type II secretion system F family protein [Erysipelotrichaceae bacterium]|nr:type II secretion system F family protein [Erysipelotrichaceae bacterium]
MELMIIVGTGALMYVLILSLFGKKMEEQDRVETRMKNLEKLKETRKEYSYVDETMNKPFYERVMKPLFSKIGSVTSKIVPTRGNNKNDNKIKKQLEQAGYSISTEDYLALQLLLMMGGGFLGIGYSFLMKADFLSWIINFLFGVFSVYALMRYMLTSKITSRRAVMEKQLPDMMDLLSVSVEAGLGFERAMLHVTESMEGPLIDELTVTYREMSMGRTRKEALTLLGERCDIEDLNSFTGAIVQAGQLGIPVRNVLRAQSEAIRRSRRSKVQEKAQQVSTKILIPMLIFIFPVLFIILLGPSVISIMGDL